MVGSLSFGGFGIKVDCKTWVGVAVSSGEAETRWIKGSSTGDYMDKVNRPLKRELVTPIPVN